jgi:hypothetical protein
MIDIVGNILTYLPIGYAIWLDPVDGTSSGINIEGNTFYLINVGVLTSYQANNYGIRIAGNLMAGNGGPPNKYGMLFVFGPFGGNKAGEVYVEGNELWVTKPFEAYGNAYTIIFKNNNVHANNPPTLGTGTLIAKGNTGYVTENSGTAVGTGSQQTIAHGCNFTPSKAQVIVSNIDNGANPYLSADPDATNIYVTAVNGKAYRWEVKMYP